MYKAKNCAILGCKFGDISNDVYQKAWRVIKQAINNGCRVFYFTGKGIFDSVCNEIVTKIKNEYLELEIERVYCFLYERCLWNRLPFVDRTRYDRAVYL